MNKSIQLPPEENKNNRFNNYIVTSALYHVYPIIFQACVHTFINIVKTIRVKCNTINFARVKQLVAFSSINIIAGAECLLQIINMDNLATRPFQDVDRQTHKLYSYSRKDN